jgi:putative copper resistance protein D
MMVLLVATRWIYFAAVFVIFGAPLFWFYADQEALAPHAKIWQRSLAATRRLLRIAALLAAVTGIAWLAEILAGMADGFSSLVDPETLRLFFFGTQFGPVSIARLALLLATAIVAFLPLSDRARFSSFIATATALLMTQAWLGHAAEGGATAYGALMIAVYAIHALAAAAWVGGLPMLLFALAEIAHDGDAKARTLTILSRFSLMATLAVTFILVSGIANTAFRVAGSFDKLFWTGYGAILLTKLGAVALMLALAYFNRFVAIPQMRLSPKGEERIGGLRASIAVELALGIIVLGVAAILGITAPPQ